MIQINEDKLSKKKKALVFELLRENNINYIKYYNDITFKGNLK